MHICVGKLTIMGSDHGLSPGWHQAIIWTNAGKLLIWPLGTNFSEMLIEIHTFSLKKMHLKMSSAKWRPFCLSLNVLGSALLLRTTFHVVYPWGIMWETSSFVSHLADDFLTPALISNYIHCNTWNEITYPLPNFNNAMITVWEWIRNFIALFTWHVITYPCWD